MNSDIITSAPRPEDLPPIARVARGHAGEPSEPRAAKGAIAHLLRSVTARPPARDDGPASAPPAADRTPRWRSALESLARALIVSIAAAPPLRALDAFVDRCLAADEALERAAEATAAAHVLRVYAQLAESEQRMVDDLLRGDALEEVLAAIVRRTEDAALELLRRRIGTVEPVVSAASLARQIGGVRDQLTDEEYDRVILRLPHLSADEQQALHSHLRAMTPDDAAMLLRSYLRPVRH